MWGHEHECMIGGGSNVRNFCFSSFDFIHVWVGMQALPETQHGVIVIQPGSTVATSLILGESKEK